MLREGEINSSAESVPGRSLLDDLLSIFIIAVLFIVSSGLTPENFSVKDNVYSFSETGEDELTTIFPSSDHSSGLDIHLLFTIPCVNYKIDSIPESLSLHDRGPPSI